MAHPIVREIWLEFNRPLEGRLNHMYLDTHDPPLVTTGVGNLIDPPSMAVILPWRRKDNQQLASRDEILAEWANVKKNVALSKAGGAHFGPTTRLYLEWSEVDRMVLRKFDQIDAQAARRFANWNDIYADAQVAVLSMSYAMGDGRFAAFPKFCRAIREEDYVIAAKESHMRTEDDPRTPQDETNRGLEARNDRNETLLNNAAYAKAHGLCPSELLWPAVHVAGL